ncbi:MAG: glutamate--tRNA ligase [Alphaproteobacteria bacterium]|nr:glutamate--tRNA ligase [Alphaproteobacteria bacterium]
MSAPGQIVTRFAPSPTGFLHIGGARTALFNWLFARHTGGAFRLRIEDTDRQRSTPEAIEAILEGMAWLGLDHDGEVIYQFARAERHRAVAEELMRKGAAYHCYASQEELSEMRDRQKAESKPLRYDGRWRDRELAGPKPNAPPVVRLKAPQTGETIIDDKVQGEVRFRNDVLDDFVLLRADGTPTYMLSVVVDDYDMGVTHIIRGDDHLTNAARQRQIIDAMGWPQPTYAHLPLLHGPDGAKLSKRHGAQGIHEYRDLGYLPEGMRNYLLRLGWSHGDDEIIPTDRAIEWFNLESIGRSPARIDFKKLDSINGHYIRAADDDALTQEAIVVMQRLGRPALTADQQAQLRAIMPSLKERAKTVIEIIDGASFISDSRPLALDDKAQKLLSADARRRLGRLGAALGGLTWTAGDIEAAVRAFAEAEGAKLGDVAQPLRAALTGKAVSPPVFDVMATLGREEALARLRDQAAA